VIIIKNKKQINGIRKSSKLARQTLLEVGKHIKPGVSTEFLDKIAVDFIKKHKAIAAPLNYGGFPKSICTSINNVVCHGIPSSKEILKDGDIINVDITTILDGYYGDTSITFGVGEISKQAQQLIDVTKKAMVLAIKKLKSGRKLNDCVGQTIDEYISTFAYSAVRQFGGHGVGIKFHEEPLVFHYRLQEHYDNLKNNPILKEGMILTVEPMINASLEWEVKIDENDGWTVRTIDGALSAQFEHTILITKNGHEVLTKLEEENL